MSAHGHTPARATHGLRQNILVLYVVQVLNFALPLISVPYLVRVLGASSYGLLALASALIVYFAAFTDFGFGTAGTRAAAAARDAPRQLGALLASVTVVRLGLMCIALLALAALLISTPRFAEHAAVYAASALTLLGTALFPNWLLQGLEAMRTLALATVTGRLVAVGLIFALVHDPADVALAAALQSLSLLVALLVAARPLMRLIPRQHWKVDRQQIPTLFADSRNAFICSGAVTLYTSATTLVLGFFAPAALVGAFSAASKIVVAISSMLWAPISQGVYPRLAAFLSRRDAVASERLQTLILRALLPLAAVITVVLWVFAEPLVRIVLGSGMEPAVGVLRVLAPLPALLILSNYFGVLVLFAHGEFAAVSRFQVAVAVVSLVWLLPLVQLGAAEGAAWSALITEAVITVGFIYLCRTRGLLAWARTISS